MKRLMTAVVTVGLALGLTGAVAAGDSNRNSFKANLSGYQSVPAISSSATGSFTLSINPAGTQISYSLTYSALQGGNALAAHIHFGQANVNGAPVAFLCGGGGKPACPAGGGTVTGTVVAADILSIPTQGIAAGDYGAFLRALRAGVTYVNVHSVAFPAGEIRGQIPGGGNRDHGNGD
jgi:hypothetical protein